MGVMLEISAVWTSVATRRGQPPVNTPFPGTLPGRGRASCACAAPGGDRGLLRGLLARPRLGPDQARVQASL